MAMDEEAMPDSPDEVEAAAAGRGCAIMRIASDGGDCASKLCVSVTLSVKSSSTPPRLALPVRRTAGGVAAHQSAAPPCASIPPATSAAVSSVAVGRPRPAVECSPIEKRTPGGASTAIRTRRMPSRPEPGPGTSRIRRAAGALCSSGKAAAAGTPAVWRRPDGSCGAAVASRVSRDAATPA